jgi:hypothetical protein
MPCGPYFCIDRTTSSPADAASGPVGRDMFHCAQLRATQLRARF